MRKTKKIFKVSTCVRLPELTMTRAKKIARQTGMRFTDYFTMAVHDANQRYSAGEFRTKTTQRAS